MKIKKLVIASLFTALGVSCSTFYIPVGVSKCFPVQHALNVLSAMILGPAYSVVCAFAISLLRNVLGMGSLLAFPGSIFGAFFAAFFYRKFKNFYAAFTGEVIGTGIIGAMVAYPVAAFLLNSSQAALFFFVIPFSFSSVGGAIIAWFLIKALEKTSLVEEYKEINLN